MRARLSAVVLPLTANAFAACAIEAIPAPDDVAEPPTDAMVTMSGLTHKRLRAGTGTVQPGPTSAVKVTYTGWTTDGAMFDTSTNRGDGTATFGLDQVIAGWTEGVQLMVAGEQRRFWIPESLAYRGQAGFPAGTLVFDIELIAVDGKTD